MANTANPWPGVVDGHYENFPVGSWLLPARIRPAVAAIYRFARHADDVADEGEASPGERLARLRALADALAPGAPVRDPVVEPLRPWIASGQIERERLTDLLSAFEQDVLVQRYQCFDALLDYCRRSADPVGRMMLRLFGCDDAGSLRLSDSICSALQLINFLQDLAIDLRRQRLYLPLDEFQAFGLTEDDPWRALEQGRCSRPLAALLEAQGARAGAMLDAGRPLLARVPLRLSLELRAILAGGGRILSKLQAGGWDPIARRPRLGASDLVLLLPGLFRPAAIIGAAVTQVQR